MAMKRLTQSVHPMTGEPRRYRSLNALKADCPLEYVVASPMGLDQDPENPHSNRLKFLCFRHDDHNPSLYVNVEQQRWGCETGCFDGRSDDVIGFVSQLHGLTHKEAIAWLETWAYYHGPNANRGFVRIRLPAGSRSRCK